MIYLSKINSKLPFFSFIFFGPFIFFETNLLGNFIIPFIPYLLNFPRRFIFCPYIGISIRSVFKVGFV